MVKQRFPSEHDNWMLSLEDVSLWLGVSKYMIKEWTEGGHFPSPVCLNAHVFDRDIKTKAMIFRWFRYEIEDWVGSRPRNPETNYLPPHNLDYALRRSAPGSQDIFLSMIEVAEWFGVYPSTIYRWIREDGIAFPDMIQLSENRNVFRKSDIDAWVASRPRGVNYETVSRAMSERHAHWKDAVAGPSGVRKDPHADRAGEEED
jgi:predicted DNA-binding transcriptional regulator AlpA